MITREQKKQMVYSAIRAQGVVGLTARGIHAMTGVGSYDMSKVLTELIVDKKVECASRGRGRDDMFSEVVYHAINA